MSKTADEIISDAVARLQQNQPNADISDGTVLRDLIESFAEELSTLYTKLDALSNFITLSDPTTLDSDTLNLIGNNYGIPRKTAEASTGTVYFRGPSNTGSITIPAGTSVSTPSSDSTSSVTFTTDSAVILDASAVLDPETGLYEVAALVTCQSVGTVGNVGYNTLTVCNTISGINSCTNKVSITNGTNDETNTAYVNRIKNYLSGTTLGTSDSYKLMFEAIDGVNAAYIVDPNSTYSTRGPGSIDAYIDGTVVATFTQTVPASTALVQDTTIYMEYTPIIEIISVKSATTTYVEGVDYTIVKDTTSAYKYSINANDAIVWITTPPFDTEYTITGTYNQLVTTAQSVEASDDNHIITNDVLVKETYPIYIDLAFTIYKLAGYTADTVRTTIQSAIDAYVNTDRLGKNITQSTLIDIINSAAGVDYVLVPFTKMCIRGGSGYQDLILENPFEYYATDANTYTITVI